MFVILPIILITFFSTRFLEEQFSRNQNQYLRSTLAIATSEMQQRQNSIRTAALCIAQEVSTPQAVKQRDTKVLVEKLALLRNNFNKVDYAIMLDPDSQIIARSGSDIRFNPNGRLGSMNRDVCRTGNPINANEKMPLSDLFEEGSKEFKKFTVELKQGIAGEGEYMQQALCEVTMVPVMDTTDPAKVIACIKSLRSKSSAFLYLPIVVLLQFKIVFIDFLLCLHIVKSKIAQEGNKDSQGYDDGCCFNALTGGNCIAW